ncbi:RecQ family ATP-dependent DNA helicase [Aliiglaciecola sp. 2_MG-2023]|uniref:RecQ family ATP-dependent DNA helicase n=1 Tax=unclassified Aliiglaciecola TaxID=2593648 RepID=UPI0026E4289E|nr:MULTISPECIES: RecQ family ATP-dependent DNA helicase [unclassified Aliiglaciecola]MDO6709626.1 RecQ family ATP-dependent DNA helicase [Aliiglaciecola sp. 2_MG-2023]MDO6750832.1 RecQ family ATP-dependent DNA helicase [Aliiglaciecola sp. 1_MG-2023]
MKQELVSSLKQHFGFDDFRNGQLPVIETILNNHSCLAIFPTGSGKSLCYQFSALQLPNLTLVVSPLLALMQDQLDFLLARNIAAAKVDSTLSYAQNQQVMQDARSGALKILMVSVERFKNERFRQFIESVDVSLLVVDEAHCISEWGHNFRPDYLKLPDYQKALNIPQVLLLTATATANVKHDMANKFAIQAQHIVQTGFYRANLNLKVLHAPEEQKTAMLMEQLAKLSGAGIVYVTLQKEAEELALVLRQQGHNAVPYHAGLKDQQRQSTQQQFMADQIDIVVATIAFGMGVDKSNIRFVIHYELPKSIEAYSQEIGRAGRDGLTSECITLANLNNLTRLENFVYADTPELNSIAKVIQNIKDLCALSSAGDIRWETQLIPLSNDTNVRQLPLKTLLVQLELRKVITPLFGYFSEIRFRFIEDISKILARFDGERRQFLEAVFAASPMKKVWATLDQAELKSAYPHPRNRLVSALDYLHGQELIELQSQRHTDVFKVDETKLADPDLTESLFVYFKQRESAEIQRIDDLVGFFQNKQCLSQTLARYFDDNSLTQACGHCSVCLSGGINLPEIIDSAAPDQERLEKIFAELSASYTAKFDEPVSRVLFTRFLAGLSNPYLTKIKARNLNGFGLCQSMRYQQLFALVEKVC